jgi:hypothetical protein
MAYTITRADLRARLRDEIRYCSSSGAGADADLNRRLQRHVADVWEEMVATAQGVGMATLTKTIATGDPDGYEPGDRVPLPADFRRQSLLKVDRAEPTASTPQELESFAVDAVAVPGRGALRYYLEGPGQDTSVSPPVPTAQQIRLYPPWREGQVLTLVYVVQPPTLGDPADVADDVIELDLIHEPAVRYIVCSTAVDAVSREDDKGYQRALERCARAEDRFTRALARRAGPPPSLSSYRHRGGRQWRV